MVADSRLMGADSRLMVADGRLMGADGRLMGADVVLWMLTLLTCIRWCRRKFGMII